MEDRKALFETYSVPHALAVMALPAIVSQLIILIYNLADTFFVGRANNPYMVAACSLVLPAYMITIVISNIYGTGGGTLIAEQNGKVLSYPISMENGHMEAYTLGEEPVWNYGKYGIQEPNPDFSILRAPEDFDVILVPCVGFDEDGGRIGHGAGYYDRYIDRAPDACRVCIAFEAQRLEQVVEEDTDMPMDYVVTEKRVLQF